MSLAGKELNSLCNLKLGSQNIDWPYTLRTLCLNGEYPFITMFTTLLLLFHTYKHKELFFLNITDISTLEDVTHYHVIYSIINFLSHYSI